MHLYRDILRVTHYHRRLPGKLAAVVFNPPLWAIAAYRLAHFLWCNEMVLLPRLLQTLGRIVSGIEIDPSAEIGPGLLIVHGHGVVIEGGTVIGRDATIYQGVGIGERFSSTSPDGVPIIGEETTIYAGAKVLGPVNIGHRCRIGANAVVTRSFLNDTTIAGVPARAIGKYTPPSCTGSDGTVTLVERLRRRRSRAAEACCCVAVGEERPA